MTPQDQRNAEIIETAIRNIKNFVDFPNTIKMIRDLEDKIDCPEFWNNSEAAINIIKERDRLRNSVTAVQNLEAKFIDTVELIELAESEGDTQSVSEFSAALDGLTHEATTLQIESVLSGPHDAANCYVEINSGAGGTEAQDWAEMLARMYFRWAEKRGYSIEITDKTGGDEAGVKSITLNIKGLKAYGWLKKETGVHRLVRISPFDSNARRHTSFASVCVSPEIDNDIEIEINDSDLRIDTYRSSGAGGQHVNKTDSAVRITHFPTGIVSQSQIDRSQHRNREIAMNMLRSKLYALKLKEQEDATKNSQNKTDIAWGNQIRSYVLQPYQLVKDTRTGVEKGNAMAVLDGEINEFLESAISQYN
ncbi:MAG: peptide chain release factor 2 [Holosporales bacterium]|jgi:peptide chain release factor 2|nr:peptide chain release factor 2 [Holosporales bacterium]